MTFGIYGHGRTNGVTAAFARHTPPVPTANIIGTRVRQGMPIMLAGDTGTSFHNHLHMHVVPEVLPRPGGNAGPVVGANRGSYTVPFVFSDVDGNGVCKARHWYTATQARRTS